MQNADCLTVMSAVLFAWNSGRLKSLDPFSTQKEAAFTQSLPAVTALASYLLDVCTNKAAENSRCYQFSALFHVRFVTVLICTSFRHFKK